MLPRTTCKSHLGFTLGRTKRGSTRCCPCLEGGLWRSTVAAQRRSTVSFFAPLSCSHNTFGAVYKTTSSGPVPSRRWNCGRGGRKGRRLERLGEIVVSPTVVLGLRGYRAQATYLRAKSLEEVDFRRGNSSSHTTLRLPAGRCHSDHAYVWLSRGRALAISR